MRILLTADPEIPVPPKLYGGIERIVDSLVRSLKKRGHEVGLVAHRDSASPADRFWGWPALRSQGLWNIVRNTQRLSRVVREFRPDVLHSFSRIFYMLPLLGTKLPKIMSYQRPPSAHTVSWALKLSGVTLTFTGLSDYILALGRRAGGQWHMIHNFVDLEKYTFQPQVPLSAPLVFLSRVEKIKGAHSAIQIALKTSKKLIIAGNHSGTLADKIYWEQEILPHLGKNGIEYVGPVDDKQKNELLGGALAMIVPIEWEEPFGIVFVEALACGTPVISCPRGALPEIVRNEIEGYLIHNGEDGYAAVLNIKQIDRADCRKRVEEMFSSDVVVGQYEELYKSLLEGTEGR